MKKKDSKAVDLMTLRETHMALGKVSYGTVWKWARDGHLPTITIAENVSSCGNNSCGSLPIRTAGLQHDGNVECSLVVLRGMRRRNKKAKELFAVGVAVGAVAASANDAGKQTITQNTAIGSKEREAQRLGTVGLFGKEKTDGHFLTRQR